MDIKNIIKKRIDKLYKRYEKASDTSIKKEIERYNGISELLSNFGETIINDFDNIRLLETAEVINALFENNPDKQREYEEIIRLIRIVLKAKYEENLGVNLDTEQTKFMSGLVLEIEKALKKIETKVGALKNEIQASNENVNDLEYEILDYEILLEKLSSSKNKELITEEEFEFLNRIVLDDEVSIDKKIALMIEIKKYNDIITKTHDKVENTLDFEELKRLLIDEYQLDKAIIKVIDKNKAEICSAGDIENIKEILDYMRLYDPTKNKSNFLRKFDYQTLITILLYGSLSSVKTRYEKLKAEDVSASIFYEVPSVWIYNLSEKSMTKKGRIKKEAKVEQNNSALSYAAHRISYDEIIENINYLSEKGFDVSLNQKGCKKVVVTPNYKIRENYEAGKTYGLFSEPTNISVLSFCRVMDSIDRFIELGLHDYIKATPSRIQNNSEGMFANLYALKRSLNKEAYQAAIFSKRNTTGNKWLAGEIASPPGLNKPEDVKSFLFRNEVFIPEFINSEEMDDYLLRNETLVDFKLLENDSKIKYLDETFKVDEYTYDFNGQLISRLKVLRKYYLLRQNSSFIPDDIFMYAIIHGTLLDKEHFDFIAKSIGYEYKEANLGISRTI